MMSSEARARRPWRTALGVFAALACALGLVAAFAVGLDMRREAERAGAPLGRSADALAARIDPADLGAARAVLAGAGVPARLVGPAGRVRAQAGGPASAWAAGAPSWPGALSTAGVAGWSLRDGAVEASRSLPSGARVVLRRPLAPGAATVGAGLWPLGALVGLLAALGAGVAWILAGRAGARQRAIAAAAEATAGGRPTPVPQAGRGDARRLSRAVGALTARAAELQDAAEARVEALGAVLGPMAHPAAARTPAGSLIRNDALERLVRDATPADAAAIDEAVRAGLEAPGPASRRLSLADGRDLEVDAWGVPGGRVVAVSERTEQARLAALRRQITGAAARHLQAPVSEVQAIGSDLLGQVPAGAAPAVRRMLAAGDRMERLVGQILRGTDNDPRARPVRMSAIGAGSLAYALGADFEQKLRDRGLRLETDLPATLPPMRTDPALVHDILSELVANSATFTPRGGTITLAGRALPGGGVELSVADTGPGIAGHELETAGERFGRGDAAAGFPGAGLGLGVARALAERLGGRLILEPGPEGRARLEIPAAPPRRPAPALDEAVTQVGATSP
jgi:signal transduction histidine kinase